MGFEFTPLLAFSKMVKEMMGFFLFYIYLDFWGMVGKGVYLLIFLISNWSDCLFL